MIIVEKVVIVNGAEVKGVDLTNEDGSVYCTLVNMTPHDINYYSNGEKMFSVPTSGLPAIRLSEKNVDSRVSFEMNFVKKEYEDAENLPNEQNGVLYIVSKMVQDAVNRKDFICPDTGIGAVRDDGSVTGRVGNILGTTCWVEK